MRRVVVFLMLSLRCLCSSLFFFFNDTATTEIYTLSLHDALPISRPQIEQVPVGKNQQAAIVDHQLQAGILDRKSTRLNSSHGYISYAVFCLKKKTAAVAILLMIVTGLLVVLQQMVLSGKSFTTVA